MCEREHRPVLCDFVLTLWQDMEDHISYAGLVEASRKIQEANTSLDNRIREHTRMLAMQKCIAGLGPRHSP